MNHKSFIGALAALPLLAGTAVADYETHPEILPENRCVTADGEQFGYHLDDPSTGALDPIHCQRLFWDLPATGELGAVRVAAPFAEDPIPRFPRGLTDRLPPLYVDADGKGWEQPGPGRTKLCAEPHTVPWWKPVLNEDGSPTIGTDDQGLTDVDGGPQTGPLVEVACRRGSRSYYGPWQIGTDVDSFDALSREQYVRFENTQRLDDDVAAGMADADNRFEWSMASEFYNHFSSHHGTCYFPNTDCARAGNSREDFQPGGKCWTGYQEHAEPGGKCYAADNDQGRGSAETCNGGGLPGNGSYRNATQVPGRLSVGWGGDSHGIREFEDMIWRCNHHVVHQLPPGSYGMDRLADFRLQKGGLRNPRIEGVNCGLDEDDESTLIDERRGCVQYNVPSGEVMGGAIGEMIIQNFTEPAKSGVKALNLMFNAVGDLATTFYPPFTWHYHTSLWFPPFDAAVIVGAIHSHHRMVKGTMDVIPPNPPRLNSSNAQCGGAKNGVPEAMYVNWEWEDAVVCEWSKEADGPLIVRKNQAIATSCFVNNGVTPEAIKHGLVAGDVVENLKALGAPIPDYPAMVPASTWGDVLTESPVGDQLLYGTHPPINYRVVYKCAPNGLGTSLTTAPLRNNPPCNPNPAVDADGDYIDGPYQNPGQCSGEGNWCEPSNIIFACVGEDEMCIGVTAYYALERVVSGTVQQDGDRIENDIVVDGGAIDTDNPSHTGTPGNTGVHMDLTGDCPDCETGL